MSWEAFVDVRILHDIDTYFSDTSRLSRSPRSTALVGSSLKEGRAKARELRGGIEDSQRFSKFVTAATDFVTQPTENHDIALRHAHASMVGYTVASPQRAADLLRLAGSVTMLVLGSDAPLVK